ncbi:hypothetical protein K438DRAFT_1984543 [Mycena galopus ATCC 62051]|nr:hypothetical protein K438DRAFT_1984543 [Mycena galopus ATCC 62051]
MARSVIAKAMAVARGSSDLKLAAQFALKCADTYDEDESSNAVLLPAYFAILDTGDIDDIWPLAAPDR